VKAVKVVAVTDSARGGSEFPTLGMVVVPSNDSNNNRSNYGGSVHHQSPEDLDISAFDIRASRK
jgi:hypothetical protein